MAINFPTSRKEVIDRIKTDVQAELPQSQPFLRNSFYGSQMVGYGGRVWEIYVQMQLMLLEMFPDTATGDFLKRWGAYLSIVLDPATISNGFLTATGVVGSVIGAGAQYQSEEGAGYTVQQSVTISINSNTISSLSFNAGTVTAVCADFHNFSSNINVIISGAVETDYNGTFRIFVVDEQTFTYEISGTPTTPATGTPLATANTGSVDLHSDDYGADQNLGSGAALTLTTPVSGVDSTGYVQYGQLSGGTNDETEEAFRVRVIERYQNPNTPFNVATITSLAKTINGVTRVFVEEPDTTTGSVAVLALTQSGNIARATFTNPHGLISGMYISINGADQLDYNVQTAVILVDSTTSFIFLVKNNPTSPATGSISSAFASVQPGQTKVLFTRDNDPDIIPTSGEVTTVKNKLLTIKPAHMAAVDLIVVAPTPVPLTFSFDSIRPDTTTMQAAITANLEQFFREDTEVGQTLLAIAYESAIWTTIDPETGEALEDFDLTSPTGNVTIQSGELPTLDEVIF